MELQLQGRTALVTGAAGGIGRAVAQALTAEGVRVALLDRSVRGLAETAALCAGSVPVVADVTDEAAVAAGVAEAVAALGALHTVVCCAGISGPVGSGIEQTSLAEWQAVFAVNVTGAFLVLRAALPALRAALAASVVLVASDSAFVASPGMAPYCASKAALVQFGLCCLQFPLQLGDAQRVCWTWAAVPGLAACLGRKRPVHKADQQQRLAVVLHRLHVYAERARVAVSQQPAARDGDARVLRPDGRALPNLFAGGGAARGVSGARIEGYLSGNGLLAAVGYGALAGSAAALVA